MFKRERIKRNKALYGILKIIKHRKDKDYLERLLSFEYIPTGFSLCKDRLSPGNTGCVYVIEIKEDRVAGFFAIYRQILTALYIADSIGWTPYVSISNTLYSIPGGFRGTDNPLEYFFEPIGSGEIDDIKQTCNCFQYEGRHLKLVENIFINDDYKYAAGYHVTEAYIDALAQVAGKYFHLRTDFEKEINSEIKEMTGQEKVIGVHVRGTDFDTRLKDHPVGLAPEDYFEALEEALGRGYKYIFLATDERELLLKFKRQFGERLLYYEDCFRSNTKKPVHKQTIERNDNGYLMAREVLRDMLTLSRCDALISGLSQVSICARIEKRAHGQRYEFERIIDKGLY